MFRKRSWLFTIAIGLSIVSGCPTDPGTGGNGGGGGDPNDPVFPPSFGLTTNSNALGRNARNNLNALLPDTSLINFVASNAPAAVSTITWTISRTSGPLLVEFENDADSISGAETSRFVRVKSVSDLGGNFQESNAIHTVTAAFTLADGSTGSVTTQLLVTIRIQDDTDAATEAFLLSPIATPSSSILSGNLTLQARPTGALGTPTFSWVLLNPPADPALVTVTNSTGGSTLNTEDINVTIAPGATDIYTFLVTGQDAEFAANGTVSIFAGYPNIGIAPVQVDVQLQAVTLGATPSLKLRTRRAGGTGPFTYAWSVRTDGTTDPELAGVTPTISSGDVSQENIEWTVAPNAALLNAGIVRFVCTVTDTASARQSISSASVPFTGDLGLAIAPQFNQVVSGRSFAVRSIRVGGSADFTYSLNAIDTTSNASTAIVAGAVNNGLDNSWVVPDTLAAGVYRLEMRVVDGGGREAVAASTVTLGRGPSIDVRAANAQVAGSGPFTNLIRTEVNGGSVGGITVSGPVIFDRFNTNVTAAFTVASTVVSANITDWTIGAVTPPITAGTYRFVYTATDGLGNSAIGSTEVQIARPISLDVRAANLQVSGNGPFTDLIRTEHNNGGVGGVSVGSPAIFNRFNTDVTGSFTLTPSGAGAVVDWDVAINAPPLTPGTYRFVFTAADPLGNTVISSTEILFAQPISLTVTAAQSSVNQTGPFVNLLRTQHNGGGVGGVSVGSPLVLNSSGADVSASFLITPTVVSATISDWTVNIVAPPLAAGLYRFIYTAADPLGNQSLASTEIDFGLPLDINMVARAEFLAPGVPTRVRAVVNNLTRTLPDNAFTFVALDAEGQPAGTLSAAAPASDPVAGVRFFMPPTQGAGLYRITCTATDPDSGETDWDAINLFVTDSNSTVVGDRILNARSAQPDLSSATGAFQDELDFSGSDTFTFEPAGRFVLSSVSQAPRSVTYRIQNGGGAATATVSAIELFGTNARGQFVYERITAGIVTNGTTQISPTVPFRTLDRVTITSTGAAAGDTIELGVGSWIGLSQPYHGLSEFETDRAFSIVWRYTDLDTTPENVTGTLVNPENNADFLTLQVAPDVQGVQFVGGSTPDGAFDFIAQYDRSAHIGVNISTSASNVTEGGAAASLSVEIENGVAPFAITFEDMGSISAATSSTVLTAPFSSSSLSGVGTSIVIGATTYTVALNDIAADETHVLRVQVTDAVGNIGVGQIVISLTNVP